MMKKKSIPVVHALCSGYQEPELRAAIEKALVPQLRQAGDLHGKSVMLKPNLLVWRKKNDPACVDPRFIVETAKAFLDAGAKRVAIRENPAVQSVPAILKAMGIAEELRKLDVDCAGFQDYRTPPPVEGVRFRELEIAQEYRTFDFTADLAKAKTHGMMTLTLCVKNLFGFVNGSARLGWHLSVGRDFSRFADMLLDLYLTIRPDFNLIDAVTAMEGNGPGSGTPVRCGFISGSPDALALDAAVAPLLGVDDLLLIRRAGERDLLPGIETAGDPVPVHKLVLPDPPDTMLEWGVALPPFCRDFMREHLIARPVLLPDKCVGCGLCVRMCPPKSLKLAGGKPQFRYDGCIRCYCCQEHCPKGAIIPKRPLPMRILESCEKTVRTLLRKTGF